MFRSLAVIVATAIAVLLLGSITPAEAMEFNPNATLDTSTIDDLRWITYGPDGEAVYIPSGANPETTPVACWVFGEGDKDVRCFPEESPNGGYFEGEMRDNSPVYTDGWILRINDTDGIVQWARVIPYI